MLFVYFIAYLVLLVVVAKVLSRRMTGLTDFFLAGRTLPTVAVTVTFVATWFGAGSTIGTMTGAFRHGVSAVWLIAIPTFITCLLAGLLIAKRIRKLETLSQPEAVERQYGPTGSFLLAWIIMGSVTTFIASQLVAAGQLLQATLGLSPEVSVGLIMGAIILYSIIGGFRAVVMTDVMQFLCFSTAILILFGFVLLVPGIPPSPEALPKGFMNPTVNLGSNLAMMFTFVLAWIVAPELWQRMSAARTPESARWSALTAGVVLMMLYALVIATGMLAVNHLAPENPMAQKNVLLSLAMMLPSPMLTAAVLLGVLSAVTSTIDSALNVGTLTFTRDIMHRHIWTTANNRQLVNLSRVCTAFIGLPAAVIALYYQDIIKVLWISADIYASTMFVPIMGLFFARNSGRLAGILAMSFGFVPVLFSFLRDFHMLTLPGWWPPYPFTTLLGVSFSLLGFCLGALLHHQSRHKPVEPPVEDPLAVESV